MDITNPFKGITFKDNLMTHSYLLLKFIIPSFKIHMYGLLTVSSSQRYVHQGYQCRESICTANVQALLAKSTLPELQLGVSFLKLSYIHQ